MKITTKRLREIIKEEIDAELKENESGLLAMLMRKLEDLEDAVFGDKSRKPQHTSDQDIIDREAEIYADPNYVNPNER